jgi:LuxR family maltose regulon positive regulatory protein
MPVAWLSLDSADNQGGRFLPYLVAALQSAEASVGGEASRLVSGVRPAPPESILASLINDLDGLKKGILLVLDDYQLVKNRVVHQQVTFLLDHLPSQAHLVIISRSDPPLPLALLRARGQVVELRAADLRFTGDEAASFLNEIMGLGLDSDAIALLEGRTEGWVSGLQMAALSLRDHPDPRGFIERFSGTNRHILDYLLEEVLANQPPEVQNFLLKTSLLDRLCAPLCDWLLQEDNTPGNISASQTIASFSPSIPNAVGMLNYLDHENLFLVSLDDDRTWYRYHHLFADLLRVRLQHIWPDLATCLHVQASVWFEQNRYIPEAVQHRVAARDYTAAAGLVECYGPARMAEGDPSVLQLTDALPQDFLLDRPVLALYQAWSLIIEGRIEKARPLLTGISCHLTGTGAGKELSWVQTFSQTALAFLSPPIEGPASVALPDFQCLDDIPPAEPVLRNAADILYGMALARRGELERTVEVSNICLHREDQARGGQSGIPTLAPFLSRIYLMQGRLNASADLCHRYLDPIIDNDIRFLFTAGSMKIDLGEVYYEWGFMDEAEEHVRDGLRNNEIWRNIMTDGFGLVALARVLMAKKDHNGAMEVVERFEKKLHEHTPPREFNEDLFTLKVRVQLAAGDLHDTARWADRLRRSQDFRKLPGYFQLTLARVFLALGRYHEVENCLSGWLPPMSAGSVVARRVETHLLMAAALAGLGRLPEALSCVSNSLALAEPNAHLQVFLDVGPVARDLLEAFLRTSNPEDASFARIILDSFSNQAPPGITMTQPSGLTEKLSARELEVLRLMALGRTNHEIARELVISPGTVKAHTAAIYRKLEAPNRTAAVSVARRTGILT